MNATSQAETDRFAEKFPREPQAAQAARRFVETTLDAWDLAVLREDADLIISELVANAVRHTNVPELTVSIRRVKEKVVRLGVADGSRAMPHLRRPCLGDLRGRGLLLIDALSDRWGADRLHWGKRVWAELGVGDEK
ncbi:ATP-binding protein [Streptomyces sp. NPDC088387]|uniref:ATP-binding protein n=1 Tax=Streptomyces sp. NPDC088387 TaxID=3365859 RepID=UPI0038225E9D